MIDVTKSGIHIGDCRELLRQLPDGCVQTCVTSPPYWGLRDYGCDGTKRLISACADLAILEMEIEETLGLGRKTRA